MRAKEQQEALDNLIRQTIIGDSFLSFTKSGESPVQWIHLLDTIDQQAAGKELKLSKLDSSLDAKDNLQHKVHKSDTMSGEGLSLKESLHSGLKCGSLHGRGLQTSGDRFHTLKLPEAMVALAQQAAKDLPGWPLMSNKVQLQKCEKCSQEFFSPLNLRRHLRTTHRRPLNADKEDLRKKKEQVGAYWDKLSLEGASEVVSFKNISLLDLSAASVVRTLSSHLQQPSLLCLPQPYVKVASALLDIVQNKPSMSPLSSTELFSILEEASEKNLLCGVTSSSMHRSIFDSEPGRVGLESRNLVASLGFLLELNLVKAWMDDKDVEALRCQKALVEEEEAAQKKRAKLQERKRQKKMRQKESKDKERKGCEPLSTLQTLKLNPFVDESRKGHGERDDSPTVSQSSPTSSVYSCQDLNTSEMDACEGEGCSKNELTDAGCVLWEDASNRETSLEDGDAMDLAYATCHVVQGSEYDLQGETGRFSAQYRTSNQWNFGGGFGWRERRQPEHSESSIHKQPYNYSRRYYNDPPYGGQRVFRRPYNNMAASSAPEHLGVPTAYRFPSPGYSQYYDRYTGMKRPSSSAGGSHAVWARKAPQVPALESEQDGKSVNDDLVNSSVETPADVYSKVDDKSSSSNLEMLGGLSRDSSLSFDSTTSHDSSVSLSARVGAEEQSDLENTEEVSMNFPTQASEDDTVAMGSIDKGLTGGALVVGSMTISLKGDAWFSSRKAIPASTIQGTLNNSSSNLQEQLGLGSGSVILSQWEASPLQSAEEMVEDPSMHANQAPHSHQAADTKDAAGRSDGFGQVKQGQWLSTSSKPAVMKVWRPVNGGERDTPSVGSASRTGSIDEQELDAPADSGIGMEENSRNSADAECGIDDQALHSASQTESVEQELNAPADIGVCSKENRRNCAPHAGCEIVGSLCCQPDCSGCDGCIGGSSQTTTDHGSEVGEDQGFEPEDFLEEASAETEPQPCFFIDIASLLSQRWANALSSLDSADAAAIHIKGEV